MKAAVLTTPQPIANHPLKIEEVPIPTPTENQVLLRVLACGVCRTDLHIVDGELPPLHDRIIPGHQIVGEIVEIGDARVEPALSLPKGRTLLSDRAAPNSVVPRRVGVSWLGGIDGTCPYCQGGEENLCDSPTFTGYSVNGGYAEYAVARANFVFPIPATLDNLHAAPLLCAGIIGFRSLRVAGFQTGERVGLFGFG